MGMDLRLGLFSCLGSALGSSCWGLTAPKGFCSLPFTCWIDTGSFNDFELVDFRSSAGDGLAGGAFSFDAG